MRVTSRQTGATVEVGREQAAALVASGLFSRPAAKASPPGKAGTRPAARKTAGAAR